MNFSVRLDFFNHSTNHTWSTLDSEPYKPNISYIIIVSEPYKPNIFYIIIVSGPVNWLNLPFSEIQSLWTTKPNITILIHSEQEFVIDY